MIYGKIAPQARDLEEAVLGSIMLDTEAFDTVASILTADCFYMEVHQRIFSAMQRLSSKNQPIDMLTVVQELKASEEIELVGGPFYITKLTNNVTSSVGNETYCRIILQKFIQREIIRIGGDMIQAAYEESTDAFDLLDTTEETLLSIGQKHIHGEMATIDQVLTKTVSRIEEYRTRDTHLTGVPTGFPSLDRVTRGWQPSNLIILAARPSVGKCLGKGTKIIMYDGSLKCVEDVREGDLLMGDDSTPRKVLSLARGREQMYLVKQVSGYNYRVNEGHILSVMRSGSEGRYNHGDKMDIALCDFVNKSDKFKKRWKGYKTDVEFESKPIPINPYVLGVWLGDGTALKTEITNPDKEIHDYFFDWGKAQGYEVYISHNKGICDSIRVNGGFRKLLQKNDLIGNKHIPPDYIINDRNNRMLLLAGIIDTDGYLIKTGGYEITQKSERLIKQIKYLADTLGFRTHLISKRGTIDGIDKGEYFRLTIFGNIWDIPVKVERKKWKRLVRNRNWKVSGLTIEKDVVDDYYGFSIDGNHRFLLEDCTVTHNSAMALNLVRAAAIKNPNPVGVAVWSLEMDAISLVLRLLSAESEMVLHRLQTGRLDDDQMKMLYREGVQKLSGKKIFFDDSSGVTLLSLRSKARRLKKKQNIGLIIVDYLQLMTPDEKSGSREQEISKISRGLKNLSKELQIPIIALSQLSRDVEKRTGKKRVPQLSDLRESGAIEQDADVVIFLWGPEDEEVEADRDLLNRRYARIAKQRDGMLLTVDLEFKGDFQLFSEYQENSSVNIPSGLGEGNWKPFKDDEAAPF